MLHIPSEKTREHNSHHKQCEKGGENTPQHTEIGSFVFLFKIPLYKLGEEKSVLAELSFEAFYHIHSFFCQ